MVQMRSNRFQAFAHKPTSQEEQINPDVAKKMAVVSKQEVPKRALKKPTTPTSKRKKINGDPLPKTQSFDPIWDGSLSHHFPQLATIDVGTIVPSLVEPHTLILGTHPSPASLLATQYYGHPMNAFWWIVGDCLGFRRAKGTKTNGESYKFASHLRHQNVIPYDEQVKRLVQSGFALWDLIGICRRPGALDHDIMDETPNDIQSFCREHPSIRRIVITNGSTACQLFVKHHRNWLKSGQLVYSPDDTSKKAFGKKVLSADHERISMPMNHPQWTSDHVIVLVSAISVSPAAARYTYLDKRTFWEDNVYTPGLELFEKRCKP